MLHSRPGERVTLRTFGPKEEQGLVTFWKTFENKRPMILSQDQAEATEVLDGFGWVLAKET